MVDLDKINTQEQQDPNRTNSYLSAGLRDSITTLHQQFTDRSKSLDVTAMKDAAQLMQLMPIARYIAELNTVEDDLVAAQLDRRFVSGLLQAYAQIAAELDQKIVDAINSFGNQIPLIFDQMVDGGFELFARFGWYFYAGASELKKNKYVIYVNTWVGIIRYSHIFIGLSCAFLLGYNATCGSLPIIEAQLSLTAKILFGAATTWSMIVAFIPHFIYSSLSQNVLARVFRSIFVGGSANITAEQATESYNGLIELHKNIMSVRSELRINMKEMMALSTKGHLNTFYWSQITFDEISDAITRPDTLTYQDRNILIILLGFGNLMPLIKDMHFLTTVAPITWNRFGWGILSATIFTVISNLGVLHFLSSLPLKMIFAA